jgi:hypothetical protein
MVNRVLSWLAQPPGTAAPWVVLFGTVLYVVANLPAWLAGARAVGTFESGLLSPVLVLASLLVVVDVLARVARSAFDEFRPALAVDDEEAARLRRELTSIPDRIGLPMVALFVVGISAGYLLDPAAAATTARMTSVDEFIVVLLWVPVTALVGILVTSTVRQLRLVGRLHDAAPRVDLLDPGPTHAFSRLTAATAIGILLLGIITALPEEGQTSIVLIEILGAIGLTGLAIASFLLPLRGLHRRLEAEKRRRIADVTARLKTVLARLHESVDADDLSRADGLQKTQAALLAERDLYLRLSTWPWSEGTFRGFASAVVLPILLGVLLRVVGRIV